MMSDITNLLIQRHGIKRYVATRSYLETSNFVDIETALHGWANDSYDMDRYDCFSNGGFNAKLYQKLGNYFHDKYFSDEQYS